MISLDKFPEAIQLLLDRIEQLEKVVLENRIVPVIEDGDRLLNAEEAAKYLGKATQTIYGLVHRDAIPHLGTGKHLRFSKSDLKNWLKNT